MRAAIFIDGGYLLKQLQDAKVSPDYTRLADYLLKPLRQSTPLDLMRCYFYYCPPWMSERPTEDELRRMAAHERFAAEIQDIDRWQIRLGKLERRRDGDKEVFAQKRVDVQLSVDLVRHAASGQIQHVILVAGDSDFIPAIVAAKESGATLTLWCDRDKSVHKELLVHADEVHYIDWQTFPARRPARVAPATGDGLQAPAAGGRSRRGRGGGRGVRGPTPEGEGTPLPREPEQQELQREPEQQEPQSRPSPVPQREQPSASELRQPAPKRRPSQRPAGAPASTKEPQLAAHMPQATAVHAPQATGIEDDAQTPAKTTAEDAPLPVKTSRRGRRGGGRSKAASAAKAADQTVITDTPDSKPTSFAPAPPAPPSSATGKLSHAAPAVEASAPPLEGALENATDDPNDDLGNRKPADEAGSPAKSGRRRRRGGRSRRRKNGQGSLPGGGQPPPI